MVRYATWFNPITERKYRVVIIGYVLYHNGNKVYRIMVDGGLADVPACTIKEVGI